MGNPYCTHTHGKRAGILLGSNTETAVFARVTSVYTQRQFDAVFRLYMGGDFNANCWLHNRFQWETLGYGRSWCTLSNTVVQKSIIPSCGTTHDVALVASCVIWQFLRKTHVFDKKGWFMA
jgi:hypothetical protein